MYTITMNYSDIDIIAAAEIEFSNFRIAIIKQKFQIKSRERARKIHSKDETGRLGCKYTNNSVITIITIPRRRTRQHQEDK